MSIAISSFLRRSFLFGSLSDKELDAVASFCSTKKVSKGQTLFADGDPAESFYMIAYGKLKIYKVSHDGKEYIIHIHGENDIIAEAAIFDRKKYPAGCKAVEDSLVVRIPKNEFIELIHKAPSLAIKFMSAYSKRLRQFVAVIEELSGTDVKKRFARYIMNNVDSINTKGLPTLRLDISKKELASMLGTVPETISRSIAVLKKQGIIDTKNKDITVKNLNKLKAFIQN